ncbi:MAG: preprotein translocase subunit SecA [Gammaproteobacteria bacterium]|nr:preprotein translocase subunit SecA [Gammaproteobacteria bacterium]
MVTAVFRKVFGSRNERVLKGYQKQVRSINALEPAMQALSDSALAEKTIGLRQRLTQGETLDALLPDAFATVREASRRALGMRHFDVQLIGGMVLHHGKIAEMRTGEGKTLVAPLAVYLNAMAGRGVHVVTVNDYLARRDAAWMGQVYQALGLTVGVIVNGMDSTSRRASYAADVTYGTNNEFGFDYLRDNMAFDKSSRVQRDLIFAVVDEVDSILIDEARTPLIISGPTSENSQTYAAVDLLIPKLSRQQEEDGPGDYSVDEKVKQAYLTEEGHDKVEQLLAGADLIKPGESLYDVGNIGLMHHLNAALRAHALFQLDVDYIVRDNEVIIVDEFTGRTMPGRRWSEGLHQAVEAKEGVPIQNENQTLASITFQNYFRLYEKLSGMTGTADTEAFEFHQIYNLEVVVIPTHMPMIRKDMGDLVYLTIAEKFQAIIEDIKACVAEGQPLLVGTASVEASETLSGLLNKSRIKHQVLNAKQHEAESHVIAQAGRPGTVTIATNMAGRGTDIVLGGSLDVELAALGEDADPGARQKVENEWRQRHEQVLAAGGLHIVGTERHDSRRIDNQLRGRSGRQGDPGSSRFYLSLEDNLMRIFASDRVKGLMQRLGMKEGESIEHPWVTRAIENAQRKVEAHNFDIRKHLLEYDDVANDQRKVVYQQRNELMEADDISDSIAAIRQDVVNGVISQYIPPGSIEEQWDVPGLTEAIEREFGRPMAIQRWLDEDQSLHEEPLRERILAEITGIYTDKEQLIGAQAMRRFERDVMLQILDGHWKDHLAAMDYLRQGIGLRGYAQKNPKQEYKREAFEMFQQMLEQIKHAVVSILTRVQVRSEQQLDELERENRQTPAMQYQHADAGSALHPVSDASPEAAEPATAPAHQPYRRQGRKVGRNEPCWCGSGKKFKQCHGRLV